MNAGDKHTVDAASTRVIGSETHHRNMGLDTIATLLEGTTKIGSELFYNNFLSDVIANYIVFKVGSNYHALMRKVFQNKILWHFDNVRPYFGIENAIGGN